MKERALLAEEAAGGAVEKGLLLRKARAIKREVTKQ